MLRKAFPAGHPFRVVLHRRDRHASVLDCLDDFPAASGDGKALRHPVNRLVVVAVADRFPPIEREEERTLLNGKGMNHPAAVLRVPAKKPEWFEDFLALREKIGEVCARTELVYPE